MREVCFLIGKQDVVLWSDASQSSSALPDSRARWDAIWERRQQLVEIVHSHPNGPAAFSNEDETTMAAIVPALGKPIRFSVVAPKRMIVRDYTPREGEDLDMSEYQVDPDDQPWWANLIRLASGMTT